MTQSADTYLRAWEPANPSPRRYNSRIISGTCVLETLSMVNEPDMRYVFVDDFGYAAAYCRQRLREDLTPPNQRGGNEPLEHWLRMRSAFAPEDLAHAWAAADAAFSALLSAFVSVGYSPSLSVHLREIVNSYGLDLELGEIYVLPEDVRALLERAGYPPAWWADEEVGRSEQKARAFNFANERHRATLARRLREMNGASGSDEAGAMYTPYQSRGPNSKHNDHALN